MLSQLAWISHQDYFRLVCFAYMLRYKSSPAFPGSAFEAPQPAFRPVGPAFGCSKSLQAILSGSWVKLVRQGEWRNRSHERPYRDL